jgi:hypothetical protein
MFHLQHLVTHHPQAIAHGMMIVLVVLVVLALVGMTIVLASLALVGMTIVLASLALVGPAHLVQIQVGIAALVALTQVGIVVLAQAVRTGNMIVAELLIGLGLLCVVAVVAKVAFWAGKKFEKHELEK